MVSNLRIQAPSRVDYSLNTGDIVYFVTTVQNSKTIWLKIRRGILTKLAVKTDCHEIDYCGKKYKVPATLVKSISHRHELLDTKLICPGRKSKVFTR